ncbi:putative ribonuclease H-like domain-containing protein, partial [Tanacetum coccineum]
MIAQSTSSTNTVNAANSDVSTVSTNWQLALLSIRARKFYQRTRKKITINGSDTTGFDKSKVECFNCHKMGHFSRECRNPRNQDSRGRNHDTWNRNQDSTRRTVNVEDTSEKAMFAIYGFGFDWSDMAEEPVQTNMALMAFSDSEVYTDKSCSKTCLKNYETLKKQCDDLIVKLNDSEFKTATYKRGLATLEDQLVTYKKNEVLFYEEIGVLKREVGSKEYELGVLRTELEKVKKEKDSIDFKITKFDKLAKDLDEMLESQRSDKDKQGLGYHAVPPPHPLIYNRPTKLDLSYSGLDEFKEPDCNEYGPRNNVSDKENSSVESLPSVAKETVFHAAKKVEFVEPKNNEKPVKMTVSFNHLQKNCTYHQKKKVVSGNNHNRVNYDYYAKTSHPKTHKNMTPRAVLLRTGLKPLSTAKSVYTAHPKPTVHCARPKTHFYKSAQSTVQRPFYKKPALTNRHFNHKANTVRPRVVNTARPNRPSVNAARANGFNVVKPSACWGKPHMNDKGFVDSGCSRHMTGNITYLLNFKEFNGGHVIFRGGAYGGRITGK